MRDRKGWLAAVAVGVAAAVSDRAVGPVSGMADEAEKDRQLFNTIRPHEALGQKRPLDVHLEACNDRQTIKSNEPEPLPLS